MDGAEEQCCMVMSCHHNSMHTCPKGPSLVTTPPPPQIRLARSKGALRAGDRVLVAVSGGEPPALGEGGGLGCLGGH